MVWFFEQGMLAFCGFDVELKRKSVLDQCRIGRWYVGVRLGFGGNVLEFRRCGVGGLALERRWLLGL